MNLPARNTGSFGPIVIQIALNTEGTELIGPGHPSFNRDRAFQVKAWSPLTSKRYFYAFEPTSALSIIQNLINRRIACATNLNHALFAPMSSLDSYLIRQGLFVNREPLKLLELSLQNEAKTAIIDRTFLHISSGLPELREIITEDNLRVTIAPPYPFALRNRDDAQAAQAFLEMESATQLVVQRSLATIEKELQKHRQTVASGFDLTLLRLLRLVR